MSPFTPHPPQQNPRDVAADWLERQEKGALTSEDQARLDQWLGADVAHQDAYAEMERLYALTDEHAADAKIMRLRQAALAARPASRQPIWRAAMAAGFVAVIGLGGAGVASLSGTPSVAPGPIARLAEALSATADPKSAVHRTGVGERLTLTLPDGSVATLNTDSILKVAYSGGERGVRLVRGQALFEVAKNRRVPFRVYAGDRRITAVGTVFDVRLDGQRVKVALVEGVVQVAAVKAAPTPGKPVQQVQMTAGEVLDAPAPDAPMRVAAADTERTISWRSGVVEFSGEPLANAVAEMNRYTTRHIEISDPAAKSFRVSGVFRTGEPEMFARMMTQVFPLDLDTAPEGPLMLKKRG
jgi:transmembrane sensor